MKHNTLQGAQDRWMTLDPRSRTCNYYSFQCFVQRRDILVFIAVQIGVIITVTVVEYRFQ